MCLTKLLPDHHKTDGVGYKVVCFGDGGIPETFFWNVRHTLFPINEWVEDTGYGILLADDDSNYGTGFHIFESYEDAYTFMKAFCRNSIKKYHVVKVEYKDVVCVGLQKQRKVIVARKVKVCA